MPSTAEEVAADLRARIRSGELAPGTKLPTADELATATGLRRSTALRILNQLKAEGLVEYRPGRGGKGGGGGTYVRERPPRMVRPRAMERDNLGYYSGKAVQHWRLVEGTRTEVDTAAPVPAEIAELLGVPAGTLTVVRRRLNGDPDIPQHRQLTDSWLHPDVVEALPILAGDTGLGGMYDRIEEYTGQPIRWDETITAAVPSPAEAAALILPAGVALLRIFRTSTIRLDGRRVVAEVNDIRMSGELFSARYPVGRAGEARWPVTPATRDFYSG